MIKKIYVIFLLLGYYTCASQDFNGPWINILATKVDGSRIVEHLPSYGYFEYAFFEKMYTVADSSTFKSRTYNERLRVVGSNKAMTSNLELELLADTLLVIREKFPLGENDKRNMYVLLRRDRYIQILEHNQLFMTNGDTLLASNLIFPRFDDFHSPYFGFFLLSKLKAIRGAITGYFVINKTGAISNVQVIENIDFAKERELIMAIMASTNKWSLPLQGYNYKVPFTLIQKDVYSKPHFSFKIKDYTYVNENAGLSGQQIINRTQNFKKGLSLASRGKYDQAIDWFTNAIEIDPLFFDAWYNRATIYKKIGVTDKACADWKYLMDLGQTEANNLYNKNCR